MAPRRLLSVEYNERILDARNDALRRAGYRVEAAKTFLAALHFASYDSFDLVLIGHTVFPSQAALLLERIRHSSHTPVIAVYAGDPPADLRADLLVDEMEGTPAIVQAIETLLPKPTEAQ